MYRRASKGKEGYIFCPKKSVFRQAICPENAPETFQITENALLRIHVPTLPLSYPYPYAPLMYYHFYKFQIILFDEKSKFDSLRDNGCLINYFHNSFHYLIPAKAVAWYDSFISEGWNVEIYRRIRLSDVGLSGIQIPALYRWSR